MMQLSWITLNLLIVTLGKGKEIDEINHLCDPVDPEINN